MEVLWLWVKRLLSRRALVRKGASSLSGLLGRGGLFSRKGEVERLPQEPAFAFRSRELNLESDNLSGKSIRAGNDSRTGNDSRAAKDSRDGMDSRAGEPSRDGEFSRRGLVLRLYDLE